MQQDSENFYEQREEFLLTLRKEKRKQFSSELRVRNFNGAGLGKGDESQSGDRSGGKWEGSLCSTAEKSFVESEDEEFLVEIKRLYTNSPLEEKKKGLNEILERLKYGKPPSLGVLVSVKSVIREILPESELVKLGLAVLVQILILDWETLFDFHVLGPAIDWPVCEETYKVLYLASWNDQQSEHLVQCGLLDFLNRVFNNSKHIRHIVLSVLANVATGNNYVVSQIISHKLFKKVNKGLLSPEPILREDCSFVLHNLSLSLSEEEVSKFVQLINFEGIKHALSAFGQSTHKNLLSLILGVVEYFKEVCLEKSYFELFLFSKNSELCKLASEILSAIN